MRREPILLAASALLLPVAAADAGATNDRAEFGKAVAIYQGFVVARCAPDVTNAYKAARAARDRGFVRSLTPALRADYYAAVARKAAEDAGMTFMCAAPQDTDRAEAFAAGDRQFARLVELRDRLARRK